MSCPGCGEDVVDPAGNPQLAVHLEASPECRATLRERVEAAAARGR